MNLRFWAATDTGRVRDHNEDNFLVDENLQLFVICDGMGGHAAGEVASAVCVRTVRDVIAAESGLLAKVRENPNDKVAVENLKAVLRRAVKTGNARIYEMAQEDPSRRGMGTTCTAMVLGGSRGFVGHVGDSRLYRLANGEIEQITDDHSLLNEMIRQGKLSPDTTEEEFQHQNAVTRAVGVRESVDVDAFAFDINAGDRLLMCSDGLSEYLGDDAATVDMFGEGEPKEVTTRCIEFANESGGKDNITVVVVDCQRQSPQEGLGESSAVQFGDPERVAQILGETPYFYYLTPPEMQKVLQMAVPQHCEEGEVIIADDEDNDRLFLILDGSVSLSLSGEQVSVLTVGDYFGEMALIDAQDDHETSLQAQALEDASFLTIGRDPFVNLFQQDQDLALKLLWNFAQVFASRLQQVPPEYRYVGEHTRAEPDAIADVTGAVQLDDVQPADTELQPKATVGEDRSDPDDAEPQQEEETGSQPAAAEALPEDDPAPEETPAPEELRETIGLEEFDRSGPEPEPEDAESPKLGRGTAAAQETGTALEDDAEPAVQINYDSDAGEKQAEQPAEEPAQDAGDAALRSTMRLDWGDPEEIEETTDELDDPGASPDAETMKLEAVEPKELNALRKNSGKQLRDKLRQKLGSQNKPAPAAGVLQTRKEAIDDKPSSEEDAVGQAAKQPSQEQSENEVESDQEEQPKVLVSPDLLVDPDDE